MLRSFAGSQKNTIPTDVEPLVIAALAYLLRRLASLCIFLYISLH